MNEALQITQPKATEPDGERQVLNHYALNEDILHGIVFGHAVTALCGERMWPHSQGASSTSGLGTGRKGAGRCCSCQIIYDRMPS